MKSHFQTKNQKNNGGIMKERTKLITWQSREILLLPELPIRWFTVLVTRAPQRYPAYKTAAFLPILGNHPRAEIGTSEGDCEYSDYLHSIRETSAFKAAFETLRSDNWVCLLCFCSEYAKCHRRVLLNWLCDNYPEDFKKYDSFSPINKRYN